MPSSLAGAQGGIGKGHQLSKAAGEVQNRAEEAEEDCQTMQKLQMRIVSLFLLHTWQTARPELSIDKAQL